MLFITFTDPCLLSCNRHWWHSRFAGRAGRHGVPAPGVNLAAAALLALDDAAIGACGRHDGGRGKRRKPKEEIETGHILLIADD